MLYVKRVIHAKVRVYLHRSIVHLNRSVCVTKLKLCTHLPLRVCALPSSDIPYGYTLACVARLNLRTGSLSYALRLTWSFLFIPARRCGRARTRDVRFCSGFRNVSCPLGVKRDGEGVVNRVSRRSLLNSPPPCVFMVRGMPSVYFDGHLFATNRPRVGINYFERSLKKCLIILEKLNTILWI